MKAKQYTKQMLDDYVKLKKPVNKVFDWLIDQNIWIVDDPIDLLVASKLDISDKGLKYLPNEFRHLKTKILDLSGNDFSDSKGLEPLCYMNCLHTLLLSGCRLSDFPKEFNQHIEFNQIYLDNNNLTDIPKGVYTLDYIDYLDISNNPIKQFSEEALKSMNSEWIVIDDAKKQFPKSVKQDDLRIYVIQDCNMPVISLD